MRTLHLELPREISFSLKPWRLELHEALASRQLPSRQVDLNPRFWAWVLRRPNRDLHGRLLDLRFGDGASRHRLVKELGDLARQIRVPDGSLALGGLHIDREIVQDSRKLAVWIDANVIGEALGEWWREINDELHLTSAWDLVTFGVGSLDQLALASWLSARIRSLNADVHTCLACHQWENFSLVERIPRLTTEGALLELFDSAVIHQEGLCSAVGGLVDALVHGGVDGLRNLAFTLDGEARLAAGGLDSRQPVELTTGAGLSEYVASCGLERNQILYLDSIVRNDCYYGKCAFCIQNVGYIRRQNYKHGPELARLMSLIVHLAQVDGVRAFSFVDQAVPPLLLERLARAIKAVNLNSAWCVRMLAEDLDDSLLQSAASAGCREILFGIESARVATLDRIGKRTKASGPECLHRLVERMRAHGMDAIFNFIRGIPGESPDEFAVTTARFIEEARARHENLTVILNTFTLFAGSRMEKQPAAHGISEVLRSGCDLELELEYEGGKWGGSAGLAVPDGQASPADAPGDREGQAALAVGLQTLHYGSVGLLYRWNTGRWLTEEIRHAPSAACSPLYAGRTDAIFGATGYLGHNLARRLPVDQIVLTSTARPAGEAPEAPHLAQDLRCGPGVLPELAPHTAWIAARPVGVGFDQAAIFNAHLQSVLRAWIRRGSLRRVVLFSTQLVMETPRPGQLATGDWPLAPECDYGCQLAQLEVFAAAMARMASLSVDVIRLPLLWGGSMLSRHKPGQLLSFWAEALDQGRRWEIATDEEERFGNSWVDVDDLIDALRPDPGPGIRVRTVKSGDFRYADLQRGLGPATSPEPLHLHRTVFFLEDQLQLPQRLLMIGGRVIGPPRGQTQGSEPQGFGLA